MGYMKKYTIAVSGAIISNRWDINAHSLVDSNSGKIKVRVLEGSGIIVDVV
jgi:hypothetical protein